jgi:hypothetical protein
MKLKFIQNFEKEFWFIENKYKDAKKAIGEDRFSYIINQNIPNIYNKNKKIFYKDLKKYIRTHKQDIVTSIKQKNNKIEKRWREFEKDFFQQMEDITKTKWKYKNYNAYPLFSCFWGGDYDINDCNIYINPLLEYGDPIYVIFYELSHLLYWEYIYSNYSKKFIKKNNELLWKISEVMVSYPLLKLKMNFKFPLVVPGDLKKFSNSMIKIFSKKSFLDIINSEIKKRAE